MSEVCATLSATVTMADPNASSEGLDYFWEYMQDGDDRWWALDPATDYEFLSTYEYVTQWDEHVQFRVTVGGMTSDPVDLWVTRVQGNPDECPECGAVGEHLPSCSLYACPECDMIGGEHAAGCSLGPAADMCPTCSGVGGEHAPDCPNNPDSSNEGMA